MMNDERRFQKFQLVSLIKDEDQNSLQCWQKCEMISNANVWDNVLVQTHSPRTQTINLETPFI